MKPFILYFATIAACFANDIYVDNRNHNSSDSNNGSIKHPLKSLNEAVRRIKAGQTVWVSGSTYRESFTIPIGKEGNPTIFAAMKGQQPLITGMDLVTGKWQSHKRGVYSIFWENSTQIASCDNELLKQIGMFKHLAPNGWKEPSTQLKGNEYNLTPGTFYYNSEKSQLWVMLRDLSSPSMHKMEVSSRSYGVKLQSHTRLFGFETGYFQTSDKGEGNGIQASGDDIIIKDCNSHHNDFSGIYPQGRKIVIEKCKSEFNGNNGYTSSFGFNITLNNCTSRSNNTRGYDLGWHGGGLKFVQQRNLVIINHISENEGMGIWLDVNCLNSSIINSKLKNCGIGIYYEIGRWGVIINNTLENCKRGIWSYSSDMLIANNEMMGCKQGIIITGDHRCFEYNLGYGTEPGKDTPTVGSVRNNVVINNLIINASECNVGIWTDSPFCGGNICDWNAYVKTPDFQERLINSQANANKIDDINKKTAKYLDIKNEVQAVKENFTSTVSFLNRGEFGFWSSWGTLVSPKLWNERGFDLHSRFINYSQANGYQRKEKEIEKIIATNLPTDFTKKLIDNEKTLKSTGRNFSIKLDRGKDWNGHPWVLIDKVNSNETGAIKVDGMWFKGDQPLPFIRKITIVDECAPMPVGPVERFNVVTNCPSFN